MAQRRMFSFRIINSARFLQMPQEAQNLYFHLGIRADDDGVAEAYPVMRMLGTADDVLKVLVAKNFIKLINNDLVVFVVDWHEHNNLRSDRKIDGMYMSLLEASGLPVKKAKPRADTGKVTGGRPMDGIGKVRLGKDSILISGAIAPPNDEIQPKCQEISPEAEKHQELSCRIDYEVKKTFKYIDVKKVPRFSFFLKMAKEYGENVLIDQLGRLRLAGNFAEIEDYAPYIVSMCKANQPK